MIFFRHGCRLLVIFLLFSAQSPYAAERADVVETVGYTVAPTDTLISIARRYFLNPQDWPLLQQLNNVKNPTLLQPGITLKLPIDALKYRPISAKIGLVIGETALKHQGQQVSVFRDQPLAEGMRLETGRNSFITVEIDDGSKISLPSNSVTEVTRLRTLLVNNSRIVRFTVINGKAEAEVNPQRPNDKFEINTRISTAGVRGTYFRVRTSPDQQLSVIEALDGQIAVQGHADSRLSLLNKGNGIVVEKEGLTRPPVPMFTELLLDQKSSQLYERNVTVSFLPLEGAASYLFQLSKTSDFSEIVVELERDAPLFTLSGIADGRYYARALARDKDGITGFPLTHGMTRIWFRLEPQPVEILVDRPDLNLLKFTWQSVQNAEFWFVLARNPEMTEVVSQLGPINLTPVAVHNLAPDKYYWQIRGRLTLNGMTVEKTTSVQYLELPHTTE